MTDKYAQPEPFEFKHLPGEDGESLIDRIRRVTAKRDRQAAIDGHQEILNLGRARSKRMKGSGQ